MTDDAGFSSEAVAVADRLGELLARRRSAEAEIGALLVGIEQRGVMEVFGYRSAARLYEHLADVSRQEAARVVKRARLVNAGRNLDGSPIPALAPATGAAALTGRLSTPMIDTITGVLAEVPVEHRESAEANWPAKARRRIAQIATTYPGMFIHWRHGALPAGSTTGAV